MTQPAVAETHSPSHEARLLMEWQATFGLDHLEGRLEHIHPLQVTDEWGQPGAELVGVVARPGGFTIVHTRPLGVEDIVHELLHVLRPDWPHEIVEEWTARLVARPALAVGLGAARAVEVRFPALPAGLGKESSMQEYKAYNLRTKQECTVLNPEIVTLKNGRRAVRGIASDDGKTRVMRVLGGADAQGVAPRPGDIDTVSQ
jgi:hypothetical protein